ncbi:MAG: Ycf51 family protein [Synechococcus sp.]|nr:Ycf51 family protein [Synechococcus sp.]
MALDQLLLTAAPWLAWSGLGLGLLTVVAFIARWGLRFRLVGVSSFTLLLAVSCWAFGLSYTPPVVVEGAVRAPVVFDNGTDLVVAQAPADLDAATVTATLEQLAGNLRGAGRGSRTVAVRLRALESGPDGSSRPVILGELKRDFARSAL